MKNLFSKLLCVALMVSSSGALAQVVTAPTPPAEPAAETTAPVKTEESVEALELLYEIETLDRLTGQVNDQISKWLPLDEMAHSAAELATEQVLLAEKLKQKKRLSSWDLRRAVEFKDLCSGLFKESDRFKKKYADFVTQNEALLKELKAKNDFFRGQVASLPDEMALANQDVLIGRSVNRIETLISQVKRVRLNYTALYQSHLTLLTNIATLEATLTKEIERFKTERFKKNSKALYQPEFYSKLKWDELWHELRVENILSNTGWSSFSRPPAYAVILFWILLVVSLVVLLKKRLQNVLQRQDALALFAVFAALKIIDALSLPLTLYRVFLLIAPLLMAVYAKQRAKKHAANHFSYFLSARLLSVVLLGVSVAEFLGYHLLAVTLLHGAIKTIVLFFVMNKLRVYFANTLPMVMQNTKLIRYQLFLLSKQAIQNYVRVLFYLFSGIAILVGVMLIWGAYENIFEAALAVLKTGLSYRDHSITIGMMAQAVVATVVILGISTLVRYALEIKVYPTSQVSPGTGKSIGSLIQYVTWLVVAMLVFSILGFEFQQLAIIFGALSVGIGFGLQNFVNNIVSGLILLFERPIKVGDLLEINNQWGRVEKVGLRSTIIRSDQKAQIIIPNSEFVSQRVVNLTLSDQDYRITTTVGVAYGSDTALVQKIILEIAAAHPLIMKHPEPKVYFMSFGESSLNFELWASTPDVASKRQIISDLNLAMEKKFKELGVVIPFPQRDVHIKSA